ncbi:MAG: glycosyltransferase [Dysgonamonadaceae bacterium]|jgi:glycosyltransferase involved in cell wall biosynthesis|nr:glycosyltransferase [Dysgonamonadaceae bacterium]
MNQNTSPLITVVTVNYNNLEALEKTIQNVIAQTYRPIEYIVIDGASTDGSVDIIKKYESKITDWFSEKDAGIYNAMNKGIERANGEWICFLNCGDVFVDNQTVQRIVDHLQSSDADIVYGNIFVEQQDGTMKERIAREPCNIHRMHFCHQSAFVKTVLLRNYLFDESHKMSADLKFFKQCHYDKRKFVHVNFPIVIYDTSGISNVQRQKGLRDNIAVIKEIDKGLDKYLFLFRLYFVIYWRMITGKIK